MAFWGDLFAQEFMRNAFVTGTIVAVVAGFVGFFVVVRGVSFASHALAQVGFAGASGAVLIGVDPLWGLVLFAGAGALGMGVLGAERAGRDAVTALILVAALGAGALFLTLNNSYATAAFALLFGTIVGISGDQVWQTALLGVACLAALAALYRPLLLSSIHDELAAARGVPVQVLNVLFLLIVGVAAAVTVPVAGTLLIFSLMVGPAAAATRLIRRPAGAMLLAAALGVGATWLGLVLAYVTSWPVGFFISTIVAAIFLLSRLAGPGTPRR